MDIHPALRGADWARSLPAGGHPVDAEVLAAIVASLADQQELWRGLVRHDPRERWYERVALTDSVEVWLISWWEAQGTAVHDHGGAAGALAVVGGVLQETLWRPSQPPAWRLLPSGTVLPVPVETIHRVENVFTLPATSIHAYSPPGVEMTEYPLSAPAPVHHRPLVEPALAFAAAA